MLLEPFASMFMILGIESVPTTRFLLFSNLFLLKFDPLELGMSTFDMFYRCFMIQTSSREMDDSRNQIPFQHSLAASSSSSEEEEED